MISSSNASINQELDKHFIYKSPFGDISSNGINIETSRDSSFETVAIALTTALNQFGTPIKITGDNKFKKCVAQAAAEMNINISFSDQEMNTLYKQEVELNVRQTNQNESRKMFFKPNSQHYKRKIIAQRRQHSLFTLSK